MDKYNVSGIPVTYTPQKAKKVKLDKSNLWAVDMLGFNQKIGSITNTGSTIPELQSLFDRDSEEWWELETRWKLVCKLQSVEIDSQKGLEKKPIFKHWLNFTKLTDEQKATMTQQEIDKIEFNNKLVIDKRPYFMRYLYSDYNLQYKNHVADFDRYCMTMYGYKYHELPEDFKSTNEYAELKKYYDYRCPLLETNGTMNRICYYMENALKNIKSSTKKLKNEDLYDILHNYTQIDQYKLAQIENIYNEYVNFKHSKMLQDSEFSTYEQFYKYLRNKSLEEISNNIEELAEISLYLCYKMNKKKEFAWDVFGNGIVECLINKKISSGDTFIQIPRLSEFGDIEYLGEKYSMMPYDFAKNEESIDTISEFSSENEAFLDDIDDLLANFE